MKWFNIKRLRPGDIILTATAGKTEQVIRLATTRTSAGTACLR